jgi:outer membrane protein OmpA-like peptidoglycan-associated protein
MFKSLNSPNSRKAFKTCTTYALIAALSFTGLGPMTAIAANVKYYPQGAVPQPIEVARMLAGPQFKPTLKMRGVQIIGGVAAMPTEPVPTPGQPQPIIFAQATPAPVAAPAAAPSVAPAPAAAPAPVQVAAVTTAPPAPQAPVPAPVQAAPAPAPAPAPSEPQIFALSVPFAFNSAKLQPAAFEALDSIAEGIKLVKLPGALVIEGHTDAKGGDAYNMKLSIRRAAAVKRYFAEHHGIAPTKLKAVGKGRAEPLNGQNPFAPENRRVQFRLA